MKLKGRSRESGRGGSMAQMDRDTMDSSRKSTFVTFHGGKHKNVANGGGGNDEDRDPLISRIEKGHIVTSIPKRKRSLKTDQLEIPEMNVNDI
jgi:hypothetical protein